MIMRNISINFFAFTERDVKLKQMLCYNFYSTASAFNAIDPFCNSLTLTDVLLRKRSVCTMNITNVVILLNF